MLIECDSILGGLDKLGERYLREPRHLWVRHLILWFINQSVEETVIVHFFEEDSNLMVVQLLIAFIMPTLITWEVPITRIGGISWLIITS